MSNILAKGLGCQSKCLPIALYYKRHHLRVNKINFVKQLTDLRNEIILLQADNLTDIFHRCIKPPSSTAWFINAVNVNGPIKTIYQYLRKRTCIHFI